MNRSYMAYVAVAALLVAALAVAGVSISTVLPFAVVLVCPLMMVFMMKGMGGMHGERDDSHSKEPKS